jgi:hypothetical protein
MRSRRPRCFSHARSKLPNALPIIITHGWLGSVIEQLKIIEPLTNPTAHGGTAPGALVVVIPSLPGHGFSGTPTATGWGEKPIPTRLSHTCEILAVDRQPNAPKLFSAKRPRNLSGSLTDRYGFSSRLCRPAP